MDGSLVHGELNPEYFGLTSNTLTEAMFFVDSKNPINSVSFLTPTKFKPDEANEELPHVWKVFSQKPLTDGDLNDIFKGNYFHIFAKFHGLRTPKEEIAFTARPKIQSKFLGTTEVYFVCHIGPIFQTFLIYAFIGCP